MGNGTFRSTVGLETRIGKEIAPAPIEIFIVKQEESFPRIHQRMPSWPCLCYTGRCLLMPLLLLLLQY